MEDDPEAMQIAFEQFMLGTKAQSSNTPTSTESEKKRQDEINQEKKKRDHELKKSRFHQRVKKIEKRYWNIFISFREIVQNDWIPLDDEMDSVVQSISNIRSRLPLESAMCRKLEEDEKGTLPFSQVVKSTNRWKNHGLRRSKQNYIISSSFDSMNQYLTIHDINQSISHDVLQHEKMMNGLRKLLSDVSESQKKLSKLLEDVTDHHSSVVSEISINVENFESDRTDNSVFKLNTAQNNFPVHLVDHMKDVFDVLSLELYRKQILAQLILGSTTNKILSLDDENEVASLDKEQVQIDVEMLTESDPRLIASMCSSQWPRDSSFSAIDKKSFDSFLNQF